VRSEELPRGLLRPEAVVPLRQPFLTEPEALPVIDQEFDRRAPAIAENEHAAAERVLGQFLPHTSGETVDAATKIRGLGSHPNTQACVQREHGGTCQQMTMGSSCVSRCMTYTIAEPA
jgi:hypothetical protein